MKAFKYDVVNIIVLADDDSGSEKEQIVGPILMKERVELLFSYN